MAHRSNSRPRSALPQRTAEAKQVAEPAASQSGRAISGFAPSLLSLAERDYATHRTIGDVERPERFIRSPLAHLPRPVAFAPRQSSSLSRERPAGRAAYSGVHAFAQKVRPKTGLHHAHEDRTD